MLPLSGQLLEEAEKGNLCSCWDGRSYDGEGMVNTQQLVSGGVSEGGWGKGTGGTCGAVLTA